MYVVLGLGCCVCILYVLLLLCYEDTFCSRACICHPGDSLCALIAVDCSNHNCHPYHAVWGMGIHHVRGMGMYNIQRGHQHQRLNTNLIGTYTSAGGNTRGRDNNVTCIINQVSCVGESIGTFNNSRIPEQSASSSNARSPFACRAPIAPGSACNCGTDPSPEPAQPSPHPFPPTRGSS